MNCHRIKRSLILDLSQKLKLGLWTFAKAWIGRVVATGAGRI